MLSDADAAFQLVDPAVAAAYAAAAGNSGSSAAAGAAAASAGLGGEAQLGLYQLLEAAARPSADVAPGEEEGEQEGESDEAAQQAAEMELELVASAAAVDDSGSDDGAAGFDDAAVRLAAPDQIPDSADQRRAAALATALEASQAQHLAAARRQQRRVTAGRASQDGSSTLSLDITVDADSPGGLPCWLLGAGCLGLAGFCTMCLPPPPAPRPALTPLAPSHPP